MLRFTNPTIRFSLLTCLLALLTSCSGDSIAKNWFAPDPQLQETSNTNSPRPQQSPSVPNQVKLPEDFPSVIPLYPEAQLQKVISLEDGKLVQTSWKSTAATNIIASFYQQKLQEDNWKLVKSTNSDTDNSEDVIVANRDDLQVKVSVTKEKSGSNSELMIQYQPREKVADAETSPTESPTTPTTKVPIVKPTVVKVKTNFSDLTKESPTVQQYIQDLAALGVLTLPKSNNGKFEPAKTLTRREFARWLLTSNNKLYGNSTSKQIRLGSTREQPAFSDVSKTDPDFGVIQGLADAGLIPSRLTGNSSDVLFRPDAPLTRQDLLLWKVPLDVRKSLPKASVDSVKETWGFQDTGDINPQALSAILADHNNGEKANIRRMLGYTTLFQPKKPVTRAQAASALWYFGYQGEGISAQEVLKAKPEG